MEELSAPPFIVRHVEPDLAASHRSNPQTIGTLGPGLRDVNSGLRKLVMIPPPIRSDVK
jgi:hypothetical protein